ncbi:Hsp20/alpha crystallin family protein [bacterium]|nr:Hsp20/alpha crystallin family protein [bacterium]
MFKKNKKEKKSKKIIQEPSQQEDKKNWIEEEEEEGELLVDVFQDKNDVVIRSTVAGVKPEDIDIDINNDMITIRGKRKHANVIDEDDYFYQECYWGSFSRSIILPCEVQANKVKASLKEGVLTIKLPKSKKDEPVKVNVEIK